ncbi:MAG TPA: STAS domain-containing protein [Actinocrinis sp.]|nr:STAS domain-containing protein [Actinocrinis sp.]
MDVYFTRRDERAHMISVRGEVDLATAGDLLLRLRMLAGTASEPILLDLSQITFIDCAGLRTLRAFDHHVATVGGSVHVAAVSVAVARLFELASSCGQAPWTPAPAVPDTAPHPALDPAAAHQRSAVATTVSV